jgi:hypothetical protein
MSVSERIVTPASANLSDTNFLVAGVFACGFTKTKAAFLGLVETPHVSGSGAACDNFMNNRKKRADHGDDIVDF